MSMHAPLIIDVAGLALTDSDVQRLAHPLVGDATHGKGPLNRAVADLLGLQRLWLHAERLQLSHPISGQALNLTSPLPSEWALWDAFG